MFNTIRNTNTIIIRIENTTRMSEIIETREIRETENSGEVVMK